MEILFIKIGDKILGINKAFIQEVLFPDKFFDVPGVSEVVKGIINHRGKPVVVFNTNYILSSKREGQKDGVIICKKDEYEFGIIANEIKLVNSVPDKKIQKEEKSLFEGFIDIKGRKYYILALDKLLQNEEIQGIIE